MNLGPMLCKSDPLRFLKGVCGCVSYSPKLDGVRTLAFVLQQVTNVNVSYYSRNGKEFKNFSKFDKVIYDMAQGIYCLIGHRIKTPFYIVFDGEMMSKEKSFSSVMTQLRRIHSVDPSIFQYNLFDVTFCDLNGNQIFLSGMDYFENRYEMLFAIVNRAKSEDVCIVPHYQIDKDDVKESDLQEVTDELVKLGYEGAIFKDTHSPYVSKKSASWLKMKPFHTLDLRVVDVIEGDGKYSVEGRLAILLKEIQTFEAMRSKEIWDNIYKKGKKAKHNTISSYFTYEQLDNMLEEQSSLYIALNYLHSKIPRMLGALVVEYKGVRINVGTGYSDIQRIELYENVPDIIEVSYQEITEDGSFRFPSFVRVREDKDETD